MIKRVVTAILLASFFFVVLFVGGWVAITALMACLFLSLYEVFDVIKKQGIAQLYGLHGLVGQ